ncbi:unnamed protein product [Gadus morhua 'NCC']
MGRAVCEGTLWRWGSTASWPDTQPRAAAGPRRRKPVAEPSQTHCLRHLSLLQIKASPPHTHSAAAGDIVSGPVDAPHHRPTLPIFTCSLLGRVSFMSVWFLGEEG